LAKNNDRHSRDALWSFYYNLLFIEMLSPSPCLLAEHQDYPLVFAKGSRGVVGVLFMVSFAISRELVVLDNGVPEF
jgi:hypothetical protein